MDDETLYRNLKMLADSVPKLPDLGLNPSYSSETHRWFGRLEVLVEAASGRRAASEVKRATSGLAHSFHSTRTEAANEIKAALFRALANVELRLPAAMQGSFIPVGNAFDAVRALTDILKRASADVFIVDPYMDESALIDVAVLAEESITVRLLSDAATVKPSFKPAVDAWKSQDPTTRPLEARLAGARTLHDRLIITDQSVVWVLTQSLKDLAKRSPATITAVPAETAALKIPAYEAIWSAGTPV